MVIYLFLQIVKVIIQISNHHTNFCNQDFFFLRVIEFAMQLWISIKTWGLRLIQKASKACFGTQSSSWWVCKRVGLYYLAVCFLIIWVGSIRKFTNCAFCNSKSIFVYLRFKHEYMINRKKPFFPLLKRFDEETLKWIILY